MVCIYTGMELQIAITSYLGVFTFAYVISQGFGLLLNKVYYNDCMSYISTKGNSRATGTKIDKPRYLFLLRVYTCYLTKENNYHVIAVNQCQSTELPVGR